VLDWIGETAMIRFSHEANSWQAYNSTRGWHNVSANIARIMAIEGYSVWYNYSGYDDNWEEDISV
jgi:hypothetical protein